MRKKLNTFNIEIGPRRKYKLNLYYFFYCYLRERSKKTKENVKKIRQQPNNVHKTEQIIIIYVYNEECELCLADRQFRIQVLYLSTSINQHAPFNRKKEQKMIYRTRRKIVRPFEFYVNRSLFSNIHTHTKNT